MVSAHFGKHLDPHHVSEYSQVPQVPQALDSQVGGDHYKDMKIQVVEFCHANGIPYMEGNVIKYVCRWAKKAGLEDLKKARHYLDLIIQMEEEKCTTAK